MNIDKLQVGADKLHHQENPVSTNLGGTVKTDEEATAKKTTISDNISVSEIWGRVARRIDVREATPRQILSLSRALYEEGAITYDDHLNLSFQPEINSDLPQESQPFTHKPKDYLALWQNREQNVLRFGGGRAEIEETHRIQAILTYVDSLK